MSKIFVVGGAGKIAIRLARRLSEGGHKSFLLHRKPEQAETLAAMGGTPVAGDLTRLSATDLAALMAGSDAVIFSAGAGGAGMEVTTAIVGRGLELAVQAAQLAGISRFLLVSVFPDALREEQRSETFENYTV